MTNAKKFSSLVNRAYRKDTGFTMNQEGFRVRVTAETRVKGDDIVEVGSAYFYRIQASTDRVAKAANTYAAANGSPLRIEPAGRVVYHDRAWPKDSWAVQLFRVIEK